MDAKIFDLTMRLCGAGIASAAGMQEQASAPLDFPKLSDADWRKVSKLARRHKLGGIAVEALSRLSADCLPPAAVRQEMALGVATNITLAHKHITAIKELFGAFRSRGLHPVLLKGMGLATLYSDPKYRIVGDIDICIRPSEWAQAVQAVKELDLSSMEAHDTGMHFVFQFRHITVELHRRPSEVFHNRKRDAQFQKWAEQELLSDSCGFAIDADGKLAAEAGAPGSVWVPTPPPSFNALFVFMHLWGHIYYEHPMLRAIADWIIVANRGGFDLADLKQKLEHYDLIYPWQLVGCFAASYMGVDPNLIPFYDEKAMAKAEKLAEYLRKESDGIAAIKLGGNPLARKAANLAYYFKMLRHKAPFLPPRMITNYLANIVHYGFHGLADEKETLS